MSRIDSRPRVPAQPPIIDVKPIVDARLPHGLERIPLFRDVFERVEKAAVQRATVRAGAAGAMVDRAFDQYVHRAPSSPEDLALKAKAEEMAAAGKPMAEITKLVADHFEALPEAQLLKAAGEDLNSVTQELLGRAPTADELSKTYDFARQQSAAGKTREETKAAIQWITACGPEYRKLHADEPVNAEYTKMLGRAPNADELARGSEWVKKMIDEGKSGEEVTAALDYVIAQTPEWQEAHRSKMSVDRDAIYLKQPNGWSCGPTSLSMALAAAGLRPASQDTVNEMIGVVGARAGVGTPGSAALLAQKAREMGAQAEYNPSTDPADARAALERGHGIIVNGDLGGGGHFLYIAGLDENGQYIVADPWRPGITRWNDSDLYEFTHHGNNPPGFAEVWV